MQAQMKVGGKGVTSGKVDGRMWRAKGHGAHPRLACTQQAVARPMYSSPPPLGLISL